MIRILIGLSLVFLTSIHVFAQPDTCPDIVRQAIEVAGEVCKTTARNQACYGNLRLDAEVDVPDLQFAKAGDLADIANLRSLTTYPMDEEAGIWGVAVLKLQANLPDTLPGQNVTFILFGDAKVESEISPELTNAPTLSAASTGNVNLRDGPGTTFAIQGSLTPGETITIIGRNESGDWLLISRDTGLAWVSALLVTVDGELQELNVVEGHTRYNAPMQAFRLRNGLDDGGCAEAPASGLIIQSPLGMNVNFQINGVDVEMGSTALFRALSATVLRVICLEGRVTITYQGQTVTLTPGESLDIQEGTPPGQVALYILGEAQSLPIVLLPEAISIPPVILGMQTFDVVGDGGNNAFAITFANGDGDAIVKIKQTLISATAGNWFSGEFDINESFYVNPFGGELSYTFACQIDTTVTVTYELALVDAAGNTSPPYRYTVTCNPP